jgi:hypothetical protein
MKAPALPINTTHAILVFTLPTIQVIQVNSGRSINHSARANRNRRGKGVQSNGKGDVMMIVDPDEWADDWVN